MKILIFGATGMVGQGVLRESLLAPDVTEVVTVVRSRIEGESSSKLTQIVHSDFYDYSSIASQLSGFDACFFCLGTTSAGKQEPEYTHITYDLTMAVAHTLVARNPSMTFVYVSGRGADTSEKGSVMWARVRGRLENALLAMPFKRVFILRPAIIQPLNGARSKTPWISAMYTVTAPLLSLWRSLSPGGINTTESIGRTMLRLARVGYPNKILESADIADAGSI